MNILLVVLSVIVVLALVIAAWAVGVYNTLVMKRNRFRNSFAQIDVQLRRRYDLIPNLVEVAKGYLAHEHETLEEVTLARNQAAGAAAALAKAPGDPSAMKSFVAAESGLAGLLSRLLVTVEKYPELKADRQMARVSEELTTTENRIAFARQNYNDSVMDYNVKRETFPASLIANAFGFTSASQLDSVSSEAERSAPAVKF